MISKKVVPVPPEVQATTPAARTTAPYDTPITVDFTTAMDPATLTPTNVFLKLDTQRVTIVTTWDAGLRRLQVLPQTPLALRRTYTVEMGPGVRTAEGTAFESGGWFFQFTTNGERRPLRTRPVPGVSDESPFVMLSWDSTEVSVGNISYEIWSGSDSIAVAARAGSPTKIVPRAFWLPEAAWPIGARTYWAITVVNSTIHERLDGAVQSFTTVLPGTPEDSVLVKATDYGYNYIIGGVSPIYPYQWCATDSVISETGKQGWIYFPLSALPADVHVASARLEVYTYENYVSRLPSTTMILWSSLNSWPHPCRVNVQFLDFLPNKDQAVAIGRQESGRRLIYMSDLLAAHVEASVRRGGFYGYEFVSTQHLAYITPRFSDATYHPWIKIHYYRTAPGPAAANAP